MVAVTFQERVSIGFWWLVGIAVTGYLALGIADTIVVIMQ